MFAIPGWPAAGVSCSSLIASHRSSVLSARYVFFEKEKRWSGSRTLGESESIPLLRSLQWESRLAMVFEVLGMCLSV